MSAGLMRRVHPAVAALVVAALSGCSASAGKSDYEKMVESKQGAATSLANSGAKVQEKQYLIGKGYVVELQGLTITDDLLREVKKLGNIAELDLSRSTVTDDHLKLMHEIGLHTVLTKLDLSRTAVTNAGLAHLDGCVFLSELNLTGTKVTSPAVSQFKKTREADPRAKVKTTTVKL
jgi:hypothetical protein